jgi:hypothetical protein
VSRSCKCCNPSIFALRTRLESCNPYRNTHTRSLQIIKKLIQLSHRDNFSIQLYKSCGLNVFWGYCKWNPIRHKARKLFGIVLQYYAWGTLDRILVK